jgi:hypothetical protein
LAYSSSLDLRRAARSAATSASTLERLSAYSLTVRSATIYASTLDLRKAYTVAALDAANSA